MKLNPYLLRSTVVAALGGLLFGFDTAVIAGATHALAEVFGLSPAMLGVTVSSALAGTILGAMFAGIPGDRIGRRDSLRLMAVCYVVSALGCAFAWDWYSLVFFRFVGGLGIGGSSVLGPIYIAEVAPAQMARTAGRPVPVQHRQWHPSRLLSFSITSSARPALATPSGAGNSASRPSPP